jgi:hypothetical protein
MNSRGNSLDAEKSLLGTWRRAKGNTIKENKNEFYFNFYINYGDAGMRTTISLLVMRIR